MKLVSEIKSIKIIYEDGDVPKGFDDIKESIWPYSVYLRLKKPAYSAAFDEVNYYLASLAPETRQRLFRFYENCASIMQQQMNSKELVNRIRNEVRNIVDILDYRAVDDWNKRERYFSLEILDKVELIKVEKLEATTYNDLEAHELKCLSIALKLLTPIWGTLADMVKAETSNAWKEKKILQIIEETDLVETRVYKKLVGYCEAKAEPARNKISSASKRGMTFEKLKKGTVACAVVKFLAAYPVTFDKDIIRTLYQETLTYINTSSIADFRDKAAATGGPGSEEDGEAQRWRRPNDTRPSDRAMASSYLKNIDFLLRDMKLQDINYTKSEIDKMVDGIMSNPNSITPLHMRLIGSAFIVDSKPIISVKIFSTLTDKQAFRTAQVMAYIRFKKLGYHGLARFVIEKYTESDPGDMTQLTGFVIKPINVDQQQQLEKLYPLVNANVSVRNRYTETPGYKIMTELANFIIRHNYNDKTVFENIRSEMIDLLVNL